MVRIIIADDHPVMRVGLKQIIDKSGEFLVTAEAENAEQLFPLLEKESCDIVITDLKMPEYENGRGVLITVKEKYPAIKVIIMSGYYNKNIIEEIIQLGADGFITKDDIADTITVTLKNVIRGERVFSPKIQSVLFDNKTETIDILTKREREVLILIANGHKRKEVAEKLNISIPTVDFHKQNIKDKLVVDNLAELIHIAHKNGLV